MPYGATGASTYFCALCKYCYKMQMCNSIASLFGTNEEHVKVDSRTKFAMNLRNIQGVMSIYSCDKIKLLSRLQDKPSIGITWKWINFITKVAPSKLKETLLLTFTPTK